MKTLRPLRIALLVAAAYPFCTTFAQTGPAQAAGAIVVTGQRQAYVGDIATHDMPQNVQVVSKLQLDIVGATQLSAALDLVSGVSHLNNFGGLWDSYAIRGFAGDSNNVPTGTLVNGFNGGRGFSGPRDASSVERIDVLKGPTSALFGRGEPGGTVNIITKKPKFTPEGSITVQGGSFDTYRVEADYTHPLNERISFRVNGAYEDGDSYRDQVHAKRIFLTPSALWNVTDDTSISYELELAHQEITFDRGVPIFNNDFNRLPVNRYLGEPGDGPNKIDVLGHQAQIQHTISDKWSFLAGVGYRKTHLQGIGEYPELVAARQPFLTDGTTLSRQRRYANYYSADSTIRAEISGEFDVAALTNHLVIGSDFNYFDLDQYQTRFRPGVFTGTSTLAQLNAINVFNPVYGAYPAVNERAALVYDRDEVDRSGGLYFYDQADVTEWLKVRAGGRYDDFRQSLLNRATSVYAKQDVTAFSPQAGFVIEPSKALSLYASYGKGFRPNSGQAFNGTAFAPEKSKSYEVGAKYQSPDKRMSASMAVYQMDKTNVLTADPVNSGFVIAIGTARSKGFEFDMDAALPYDFHVLVAYAYTHAYSTAQVLDPDFGKSIFVGDPLINVPKNSGNVLLTKDLIIFDGRKATIGGGVQYIDRRLGETGTQYFLPSATLVKALASIEVTDKLRVNANIDNLTDVRWFSNSYSALWTFPGSTRSFKISASYKF